MLLNGAMSDPEFDRLVAAHGDVAAATRAEWRADEEEWTAAAVAHWSHGRAVLDRARDHMHRGDSLDIAVGAERVVGRVVAVGVDIVTVEVVPGDGAGAGDRIDLHVPANSSFGWRVVRRASIGGTRGVDVGSFRARLLELEMAEQVLDVRIGILSGSCRGRLTVGRDHVVVHHDDGDTVVALAAVHSVRVAELA